MTPQPGHPATGSQDSTSSTRPVRPFTTEARWRLGKSRRRSQRHFHHPAPPEPAGHCIRRPPRSPRDRDRVPQRPGAPRRVRPTHPAQDRRLAERLITALPSCPIPEIARPGKTLRRWKTGFLANFDTDSASSGGTEAINGIIEPGRRIVRGFPNFKHYRLRMLVVTGGLDASPHSQL